MTLSPFLLSEEEIKRIDFIFKDLKEKYKDYHDPWGFDLDTSIKAVKKIYPIYKNYFKVRVFGKENIKPNTQYMVTSNHTGQIPIDGVLISIAFLIDVFPPLVLRGMVERFLVKLPFLGQLTSKLGSILGDRKNCEYLLDKGESILVFPEGVRGINKNSNHFYELQSFSKGFLRLAIKNNVPILPVSVVGAEEMFPLVYNFKSLAKILSLPSLPISANLFPLPSPIDIYIGKQIEIPEDISSDAPDIKLEKYLIEVENSVKEGIKLGLKNRRDFIVTDIKSKLDNLF